MWRRAGLGWLHQLVRATALTCGGRDCDVAGRNLKFNHVGILDIKKNQQSKKKYYESHIIILAHNEEDLEHIKE